MLLLFQSQERTQSVFPLEVLPFELVERVALHAESATYLQALGRTSPTIHEIHADSERHSLLFSVLLAEQPGQSGHHPGPPGIPALCWPCLTYIGEVGLSSGLPDSPDRTIDLATGTGWELHSLSHAAPGMLHV